jgi:biopolymer transport protein ExbD
MKKFVQETANSADLRWEVSLMPSNSNESGGFFADINITPLTDIFLVLLIVFMVTTAVTIESAAHIDLPKPPPSSELTPEKPKGTVVAYTAEHLIYVNGEQVTERQLVPQLREALRNSTDKSVIFQGDPKVILDDMVRILDLAKLAGAKDIAIAVSSIPSGGPRNLLFR